MLSPFHPIGQIAVFSQYKDPVPGEEQDSELMY